MFQVKLNPDTFACLKDKLSKRNDVEISFGQDNPNYGVIKTKSVQSEVIYNPETETLTFQNEHKHGLAELASEDTIENHVLSLMNDLGCGEISKVEVPVKEFENPPQEPTTEPPSTDNPPQKPTNTTTTTTSAPSSFLASNQPTSQANTPNGASEPAKG